MNVAITCREGLAGAIPPRRGSRDVVVLLAAAGEQSPDALCACVYGMRREHGAIGEPTRFTVLQTERVNQKVSCPHPATRPFTTYQRWRSNLFKPLC
jgi:hypothetical protein